MTNKLQLPGAKNFFQYLNEKLDGVLTSEGPEIVDRSYDGKYARRWVVRLDGKQLGEYFTFGPKLGETEFCREFKGRLPGYSESDVALVYANRRYEVQSFDEGHGKLVDTPWQRQDGHDQVPFP